MLAWLNSWLARKRELKALSGKSTVLSGKPGPPGHLPDVVVQLKPVDATVLSSLSGPDGGVDALRACAPDLTLPWDCPKEWACGSSRSLYDASPSTGRRNGEPIADCFAIISYPHTALLAMADGVNWGEPPRRAARCAVLGSMQHMWKVLGEEACSSHRQGALVLTTQVIFSHMVASLQSAQKLILQQFGTLTTLVVSCVCRCKNLKPPHQWVLLTVTVGDSAAYVFRASTQRVEEVTAGSHQGIMRDPRWCPGALGCAMGSDPDLNNMTCSLTFLEEGDIVFLATDGVADNFDPVILRTARHAPYATQPSSPSSPGETNMPIVSPAEAQAQAMSLLTKLLAAGAANAGGHLTACRVCDIVLEHVYQVTAENREHMEHKAREREAALAAAAVEGNSGNGFTPLHGEACSSSSGGGHDRGYLKGILQAALKLPGKMDHATVVAYEVGKRKVPKAATGAPAKVTGAQAKVTGAQASTGTCARA